MRRRQPRDDAERSGIAHLLCVGGVADAHLAAVALIAAVEPPQVAIRLLDGLRDKPALRASLVPAR